MIKGGHVVGCFATLELHFPSITLLRNKGTNLTQRFLKYGWAELQSIRTLPSATGHHLVLSYCSAALIQIGKLCFLGLSCTDPLATSRKFPRESRSLPPSPKVLAGRCRGRCCAPEIQWVLTQCNTELFAGTVHVLN